MRYFETDRYAVVDAAEYVSRFYLRNMKVYALERLPSADKRGGERTPFTSSTISRGHLSGEKHQPER